MIEFDFSCLFCSRQSHSRFWPINRLTTNQLKYFELGNDGNTTKGRKILILGPNQVSKDQLGYIQFCQKSLFQKSPSEVFTCHRCMLIKYKCSDASFHVGDSHYTVCSLFSNMKNMIHKS